ncbi:MAG TPA: extracellular solute-binding protein [Ktedonobacteraceae bacterium]|nr:extracellular solute-binding protein [Ktedonobacteraceae bacterium]
MMSQDLSALPATDAHDTEATGTPDRSRMNRRQLLRAMAATSVAAIGGTALAACAGTGSQDTVKVTLYAYPVWPVNTMPSASDQASVPFYKAYASWLQNWLKQNPGVTLKATSTSIWDPQVLSTAISTGTAPSWYQVSQIGGDDAGTRAAFARGLAADTTDLFTSASPKLRLTDYASHAWESLWHLNGHYYGAPGDYYPGRGIYYRRDLLKQAGLEEPKTGWTWDDLRKLAKAMTTKDHKGVVFQKTGMSYLLTTYQFDLLTAEPAITGESWHWKYDYMTNLDRWQQAVDTYRGMVFTDNSVLQDVNYGEGEAEKAFFNGQAAMAEMHSSFYTHPSGAGGDAAGPLALAEKLGKTLDEAVGYVIDPVASDGTFGATQGSIGVVSMDPHLSSAALDKAFNLYSSFWLIDGVVVCNQASYKSQPTDANARSIYQGVTPTNRDNASIPGIPGNNRKYWGDKVVDALLEGAKVPLLPNYSLYVPPEQIAGPSPEALTDALTKLAYSQTSVKDVLTSLQQTRNQQAISLPSNASQDDFNKGARNYYKAVASLWQKNSPDFYTNVYLPWYQKSVKPIIGA